MFSARIISCSKFVLSPVRSRASIRVFLPRSACTRITIASRIRVIDTGTGKAEI